MKGPGTKRESLDLEVQAKNKQSIRGSLRHLIGDPSKSNKTESIQIDETLQHYERQSQITKADPAQHVNDQQIDEIESVDQSQTLQSQRRGKDQRLRRTLLAARSQTDQNNRVSSPDHLTDLQEARLSRRFQKNTEVQNPGDEMDDFIKVLDSQNDPNTVDFNDDTK